MCVFVYLYVYIYLRIYTYIYIFTYMFISIVNVASFYLAETESQIITNSWSHPSSWTAIDGWWCSGELQRPGFLMCLFMCAMKKRAPGCLGYVGIILPNYMGILKGQYKDPYKSTSIMESRRVFFVAHVYSTKLPIFSHADPVIFPLFFTFLCPT